LTPAVVFFDFAYASEEIIDNETCLTCHEDLDIALNAGAHTLAEDAAYPNLQILCISCHAGGAVHIYDPSPDNIENPARLASARTEQVCATCHQPHTGLGIEAFDVHAGQDISCADCHTVHTGKRLPELTDAMCSSCHQAMATDFLARSHHPLTEENIACIDCHNFSGRAEPDFGHGAAARCYSCHPGQSGPYLFEHQAVNSFTPEGIGCVACHAPHGSTNDRLLTQADDKLCLQCHAEPPGHKTAHDGELAGLNCLDCHSQIHGSYDNLFFLDPQLSSKVGGGPEGCFCHYYR
jgi:DmsE family decaheme c-type cytochrome